MSGPDKTRIALGNLTIRFRMSYDKTTTFVGEFRQMLRRFRTGQKPLRFTALSQINLAVADGEVMGIIGPNGSGKSTLLRTISGIYEPDAGYVRTRGKISALLSLGTGFDNRLSGIDNIRLLGLIHGLDLRNVQTMAPRICEFSDIGDFVHQPMKYYSTGMISRLSFSMILAMEPDILLIDETLSVGDLAFQEKSKRAMRDLMQKARCQLIVSHDLAMLERIASRIIWIDGGCLVADGVPGEVIARYRDEMNHRAGKPVPGIRAVNGAT